MAMPTKAKTFSANLMAKVRHAFRRENLPKSKVARVSLGVALTIGGITGVVLPVLGVWMLPLGIAVLSVDIPAVRRFARKAKVKWANARGKRAPSKKSGPSAREGGRRAARA